ncbi:ribosome maturation factor RimP [Alicyclobacillus vulcanalis]|uniref:Ribosome maturation factor RimP n=1 Tax=Alicyclobacillus vulcanalis TaxID=252246 RepID=A0A1N7MVB1_9BACL|nr:ribosome maturation factor RimP [Alicyclobacillus vulcanalis]SIS90012.1 ribosome maturation factor RimP [Alicyclobacillus vulcanalis]
MTRDRVTEIVERLVQPIVEREAVELVDIEYTKEGKNWYLRVYIDKPGGVDIDDCSRVSEQLSEELDRVDPIPNAYFLEVSSPGAERPLKRPADFERAVGRFVHVSLYEPLEGAKTHEGTLVSYDGERLILEIKRRSKTVTLAVPMEKVAHARLALEW